MFSAAIAAMGAIAASQAPTTFQSQFTQQALNAVNWVPDVKPLPLPKLWHGESITANERGEITEHVLHSSIEYQGQEYHVQTRLPVPPIILSTDQLIDVTKETHEKKLRLELEKAIQRSIEASMRNEQVNQLMKNYKPGE